ncbi:IS3 family transposase [Halalkalibacter nanhaiisediminis]|uniref:Helix-turn-helix protein n=1 Tax=Halalkalibacter nanhaiisediminis TaxID=688079 RepID=A0A562QRC7_9BACI|nr:IS3 family transposase [Halalkalibacter nanhaiisediminis]TWI59301.1 helix-turn-helix protein [Halalkalibacter nanhaiisediminis]
MNALFQEHLLAIHRAHPYYGYPRIVTALKEEGIHANQKRVFKQMKILGIASVIRKKRRYFGRKGSVVFPNILQTRFFCGSPQSKVCHRYDVCTSGDGASLLVSDS